MSNHGWFTPDSGRQIVACPKLGNNGRNQRVPLTTGNSHKRTWEFQRYNYHPALIFALFGPPIQPPETLGEALSKSPESTDSARAEHSLDNPATLPVESGLPVRF
jgi:hypothetical protein